ncbi:protein kinase [Nonomuraea sp. NPDC050643]|uniref:serine/threonine-protein kinase n=1 Tax=Nonomuraea sp. NPDC050643 TaxID=3155660 RepID=UPI0033D0364B
MEVPGYTELRELGHGGTGRVMLAVRDSDGLAVAIKHLSEPLRENADFVARFRAEALAIKEIDSPHTARVLDYQEGDDDAVIVMELVDGVTLRRLLDHEGATGSEAALVVLKGALLGLAEAHRHDIVHRDFKPENVLVTEEGDSKLVDFGVAAHVGESGSLSGTPAYMAPEQWDDAPAGPATDVYAATLVFYECLTGHRAFRGESAAALAYQHQHAVPALEDVEEPLRPLVEHGLAKDPALRPASAQAFLDELEDVARGAYGDEWELHGRTGLGILTLPLAALLPKARPAANGAGATTTLFHTALSPTRRLAVTAALVVATGAAVVAAFVIWHDAPGQSPGMALPPAMSPPLTEPPASPAPAQPSDAEPSDASSPTWSEPAGSAPPATSADRPAAPPTGGESTREPARSSRPDPTGTRPAASDPPRSDPPKNDDPPKADRPQTDPPKTDPPQTDPPATTQPPATNDPEPPPVKDPGPLVSLSVGVSLGLPVLGGDGDGLVDADLGLGLGSSLLGLVLVPGSVLLGRHLVVRRVRRRDKDGYR